MPRSKRPNEDPEREPEHEHRHDPDRDKRERPRRRRDGRDRAVHLEITERRFAGGPPPTVEAYTKALEQWHRLPGAVMRPATDINLPHETASSSGGIAAQPPPNASGPEEQKP